MSQDVSTPIGRRESSFFGRFLVMVTLWSVLGAAIGVPIAAGLTALGVGPGGAEGLLLQLVAWIIFWHLLIGLWAGYALLMDRSRFTPGRVSGTQARLEVACRDRDEVSQMVQLLRQQEASTVQVQGAAVEER